LFFVKSHTNGNGNGDGYCYRDAYCYRDGYCYCGTEAYADAQAAAHTAASAVRLRSTFNGCFYGDSRSVASPRNAYCS
jgi:hypothetical protein